MNKMLITVIAVAIIAGGGAFYGGMKYAGTKTSRDSLQGNFPNMQNLSPEERQQRFQQMGTNGGTAIRGVNGSGMRNGGGFSGGEIISMDDKSLTVKLPDGGSKIIFFSESTEIVKSVTSTASDLEIGKNVMVTGTTNSDGSVTAQSIQLRPQLQK